MEVLAAYNRAIAFSRSISKYLRVGLFFFLAMERLLGGVCLVAVKGAIIRPDYNEKFARKDFSVYFPTTRVLTVLELLQSHRQLSGPELAERLEVNTRTVRRYITMLQDLGIP